MRKIGEGYSNGKISQSQYGTLKDKIWVSWIQ